MTNDDYVSARGSNLSDGEGRALLRSLCNLSLAGEYGAETGKKIRAGSYAARSAVADLQAAMIKAAAYFEHYYHFNDWLGRNHCESFMHEHPSYSLSDLSHEIRAIRRDIDAIHKSLYDMSRGILGLAVRLPITILLRDADQKLAAERATREAATMEAEKAKLLQSARTGGKLRRLLGGGD